MIDFDLLVEHFRQNSNNKYSEFNNTIINSSVPSLGCTVPFVRKTAAEYKNRADEVIELPSNVWHEVDMLKGIVVANAKLPFEQKTQLLTAFADTIQSWATCDCSTVKISKTEFADYFGYFCNLLVSEKPFVCRYGVVNLTSSYLVETYIEQVFAKLSTINLYGEYYVDMAVAWLLATAMVRFPTETKQYMECEGRAVLNKFTFNKALQKMRESYRVSDVDKDWTRRVKMQ